MADWQRITELAEAVADGGTPDWESAVSSAGEDDARATISQLRAIAAVERLFGTLSADRDRVKPRVLLAAGATWGGLRIVEHVGRGRFGDVYRAWDPALDRVVALKILCHADGEDAVETHIVKEGRMMARVRHPNVVTIHGAQRIDGVTGLWMEFINGRTLASELAERGPFSAGELTRVGVELCHALTAVHGAGLVHRDVKAQNVLRDERGRIVLGDFGTGRELADLKAMPGALAGTPAYVAPELFGGQPATKRSDLYSLGALLFYLATGTYPVPGRTLRELRDAHADGKRVSIRSLRPDLPRRLAQIIEQALEPNPERRFEGADSMANALALSSQGQVTRRRQFAFGAAMALLAAVLATRPWVVKREIPTERPQAARSSMRDALPSGVVRTSIFAPPGARFFFQNASALALSPDGTHLAFTALRDDSSTMDLWVQPLGGGPPRVLFRAGDMYPFHPFWSPDSQWIGFSVPRDGLKKIRVDGTGLQRLCPQMNADWGEASTMSGTWNKDGVILVNEKREGVIYRVSASGGACTPATALDTKNERAHRWPSFLPDGKHFLYHAAGPSTKLRGVYAAAVGSTTSTFIAHASQGALYHPSGHLMFVRDNRLLAAPFDTAALRITGEPTTIADRLLSGSGQPFVSAHFSISNTDVLAYVEGAASTLQYKWFDRTGRELDALPVQDGRGFPAISHDGRKVAITVRDETDKHDLWVYDLERRVGRRVTTHPELQLYPHWSPDDQMIAFSSNRRGGGNDIYRVGATGTGEELLYGSATNDDVTSWGGDGRLIVFNRPGTGAVGNELWIYSLQDRAARPLFQGKYAYSARMSPDGRWVAYVAREPEGDHIWIRGVPPEAGEWRLGKGRYPTWRKDGREVFYIAPASAGSGTIHSHMMAVPFESGSKPLIGTPKALFSLKRFTGNTYDVAPDGQRFLISTSRNMEALNNTAITIVQNWPKLVKNQKAVAAPAR